MSSDIDGSDEVEVVGVMPGTKSTGMSEDDMSEDEVVVVGEKEGMAASANDGRRKRKTVAPASTGTTKKRRQSDNHKEGGSGKRQTQKENWEKSYNRAKEVNEQNGLLDVDSGTTIYSWLNQVANHLKRYDKQRKNGISGEEYDEGCGRSEWTSERIEQVRDLVGDFQRSRDDRKARRAAANRQGRSAAARLPHQQYAHQPWSSNGSGNDFLYTAPTLNGSERCRLQLNQHLYGELVRFANAKCLLGKKYSNMGDYQQGKNWLYVALSIKDTHEHINSTEKARHLSSRIGRTGILKGAFDFYFSQNFFP